MKRGRRKKGSKEPTIADEKERLHGSMADGDIGEFLSTLEHRCSVTGKKNSKGKMEWSIGYKAHLAVDDNGIIVAHHVTGACVHDSQVAIPLMSHDNIVHILSHGCGYVISDSPRRKQDKDIMDFLHDPCGYEVTTGVDKDGEAVFKYKERTVPMKRSGVTYRGEGEKKTCTVEYNEVQIVFWSKKYAARARKQRYEALEKVMRNPKVFDDYNVKGLLKKIPVDPRDGAVRDDMEYVVELDTEKLREAEALDGYYIIRSNVIGRDGDEKPWKGEYRFRRDNLFQLNKDVDAMSIIDVYRGLWEIEETFKITKSFLSTRPIYVRKESSIRAHFTTCFIALLMVRLLERQTGNKLNHSEVLDAVRQSIVAEISPGVYRNIVTSRNMEIIGNSMGMDLTKLWYTANEIRALSAKPKN